ncbi:hypothetical protein D3C86_846680 [compost metagenome]
MRKRENKCFILFGFLDLIKVIKILAFTPVVSNKYAFFVKKPFGKKTEGIHQIN